MRKRTTTLADGSVIEVRDPPLRKDGRPRQGHYTGLRTGYKIRFEGKEVRYHLAPAHADRLRAITKALDSAAAKLELALHEVVEDLGLTGGPRAWRFHPDGYIVRRAMRGERDMGRYLTCDWCGMLFRQGRDGECPGMLFDLEIHFAVDGDVEFESDEPMDKERKRLETLCRECTDAANDALDAAHERMRERGFAGNTMVAVRADQRRGHR